MRALVACLAAAAIVALAAAAPPADVILKPLAASKGKPVTVFVFNQGASIKPSFYEPMFAAVQASLAATTALWVAIPEYPLDAPEPLVLKSTVDRILKNMTGDGMVAQYTFLGGHSLGGAMMPTLASSAGFRNSTGQVLMGAFLTRSFRNTTAPFPVPTLVLGGELDGLCRVTRIAEEYWHRQLHPEVAAHTAAADFPVVVLRGQNHMQFAGGLNPPALVKARDLHAEVTNAAAQAAIVEAVAAFVTWKIGGSGSAAARATLDAGVKATGDFIAPVLAGMALESNYHLRPPCMGRPASDECAAGAPWSQQAQASLAGSGPGVKYDVTDTFRDESSTVPAYLPAIHNRCDPPSPGCALAMSTVTQNKYNLLDALDTGFFSNCATEMRVEMSSRQAAYNATGKAEDFNATDGGNMCAALNAAAYKWAQDNAPARSASRFASFGQPYAFGSDVPYNVGPSWVGAALGYKNGTDASGAAVVTLTAPVLKTPESYWLHADAGFHDCKLLSPAAALEWMMVDGLRLRYHD